MKFPTKGGLADGAAIFPVTGQVFCRSEYGRMKPLQYVTLGYESAEKDEDKTKTKNPTLSKPERMGHLENLFRPSSATGLLIQVQSELL
jgi:hypothetical protein